MLSQQPGACFSLVQALDPHALVAGRFAGHYGDISAGQVKQLREERDQRSVRRSFDRLGSEAYQNGIAPQAVDTTAGRAGNHANGDDGRASWRLFVLQAWEPQQTSVPVRLPVEDDEAGVSRLNASGPDRG